MSQGIYVHVPFCIRKCYYCDFNSFRLRGPERARFLDYLEREAELWTQVLAAASPGAAARPRFDTVYVGGGTPTTLEPDQLDRLFRMVREAFTLAPGAEVTVEANPGTLNPEKLAALREAGVNRISLGAQVFDDRLLARLGREHDAAAIGWSVELAREAGFASLSLDLIFALPGQSREGWRETLRRALDLEPDHLSCYSLIIEEGTPFYRWHQQGRLPSPDEEVELAMYLDAIALAEARGLDQYEISNFARPGHQCRHNLLYWRNQPYLGLGPGAHSYWGGVRRANLGPLPAYEAALDRGELPLASQEAIAVELEMDETMLMGLRLTREGVGRAAFRARFGQALDRVYGPTVRRLAELGLIEDAGDRIRLSRRGLPVANQVFMAFLREAPAAV